MAASQRYHGKNAVIEMGAGTPLDVICSFNTWTISFARELIDVTTFCDSNRVQIPGVKNVEGSFDGFFAKDDIADLWALSDSDTSSLIRITPTSLEPGVYFDRLARKATIAAVELSDMFIDIGTPEVLAALRSKGRA